MVALTVNGTDVDVDVAPERPLLWVLRDELALLGAKYGCGMEQCGACTVLVDGIPQPSCCVPLGDVAGRQVTTIEALRGTTEGKVVLDALVAANAGQCGYCLPGVAVTLVFLAQRAPVPWSQVCRALDDHLCRCGSQPRILRVARALLVAEVEA